MTATATAPSRNLEVVTAIPDLNGWVPGPKAGDADVIVEVPPSEVARLWISPRSDPLRGPDPQAAPQGPGDLSTGAGNGGSVTGMALA